MVKPIQYCFAVCVFSLVLFLIEIMVELKQPHHQLGHKRDQL